MAQTKDHHYVPRFLLSHFSNSQSKIDIYQFGKDRYRPGVSFRTQCQEKHFYGKDGDIEDAFQKLEGPASNTIKKMIAGKLQEISSDDLLLLRHFILYQSARTKIAAKEASTNLESNMKGLLRTVPIQDKFEKQFGERYEFSEIEKGRINFTNTQFAALDAAVNSIPAFLDLDMKILISKGVVKFIMSDGPVARCNQFAEFKTKFCGAGGTRGFVTKGLQIFMPISPLLCLALYDGSTYKYGSEKRPWVELGKKDCELLNCLQALHADECLYKSDDGPSLEELKAYVNFRNQQINEFVPKTRVSPEYSKGDGKFGQLIVTSTPDAFTHKQFSFTEIIEKKSFDHLPVLPPRSEQLMQDMARHHNEIKKKKEASST